MKLGTVIPIVGGLVVTLGVLNYFRVKPPARPRYFVAIESIDEYQRVPPHLVETVEWTEPGSPPDDYVSSPTRMFPAENNVTLLRFAKRPIGKGKPITDNDLFPVGTPSLLKAILMAKPDTCAVPVKVDAIQGGAGFVEPGDRVDVLAVLPNSDGNALDLVAKPILHGIMVLAINQSDMPTGSAERGTQPKTEAELPRSVTLALTSKQSIGLSAVAASNARIQLILRDKSAGVGTTEGVTLRDAMGFPKVEPPVVVAPPPPPPPPPAKVEPKRPPSTVIEVWRGSNREKRVFHPDGKGADDSEAEESEADQSSGTQSEPPRNRPSE